MSPYKEVRNWLFCQAKKLCNFLEIKETVYCSRSSAEAEYKSIATTVTEIIWLLDLMKDLGFEVQKPVNVFTDSKAAIC